MRTRTPARRVGVLALALVAGVCAAPAAQAQARTVVVTGPGDAAAAVRLAGGAVVRSLPLVHGVVARLSVASLPGFAVTPDVPLGVTGQLTTPPPSPTEVTPRAALGLDDAAEGGDGVTVAVVDTGVADVPELAGRVEHVDVTGDRVGDGYGHGTFVASLVAGATVGVAPAARVLDVRVGHDDGSTSLVDVVTGLQVVSEHPEVRVVNLALSAGEDVPPLTDALDALWAMGDTVVVPAGNDGPGRNTVSSPGDDPWLLTVGATDGDRVAEWSSRGRGKPDVVAPGAHLLGAAVPGSLLWTEHPDARRDGDLFVGSGTSFSTAVVAGAAAVLVAQRPALSPYQVKALVRRTAATVAGPRSARGAGALALAEALVRRAPRDPGDEAGDPEDGDGGTKGWDANAWAARQWSARQWAANAWAARQWTARQWSARQWSAGAWG